MNFLEKKDNFLKGTLREYLSCCTWGYLYYFWTIRKHESIKCFRNGRATRRRAVARHMLLRTAVKSDRERERTRAVERALRSGVYVVD